MIKSLVRWPVRALRHIIRTELQSFANEADQRTRAVAALVPFSISNTISQNDILRFCGQLAPYEVEGYEKTRLGNDNDGGYVVIDDFAEVSQVISCGVGPDVTFDYDLAEMGKAIVQFDHTVERTPMQHKNFEFRKQAIDALGRIPGSVRLWDVVKQLGDPSKSDLLLKIDIDGDEWSTFANFPLEQLKRFRQIVGEFHWSSRLTAPEYFTLCSRAIETISGGFFPVHMHANNFVSFANVAGVPMPEVFEVTFANRELYRQGARQQHAPTKLDNPNDPGRPDLFLGSPFHIG